jgi:hypothetical protein
MSKLEQLPSLMEACSNPEKNEATSYPFWCIVTKAGAAGGGRYVLQAGPWFSREKAQDEITSHSYRYPKSAFVYCFSGHMSSDYKALCDAAREAP